MLDIQIILYFVLLMSLVLLGWGYYINRRKEQALDQKKNEILRQQFANKRNRIIREIAARMVVPDQGTSQSLEPARPQRRRPEQPKLISTISIPKSKTENAPPAPQIIFEPNEILTPPQMPAPGPAGAYQPKEINPLPQIKSPLHRRPSPTQKKQTNSQLRSQKPSKETSVNVTKERANKNTPDSTAPFYFDEDQSLYEQIDNYASWLAAQSGEFKLVLLKNDKTQVTIPLIIDPEELQQRNGHWVDLFRPPNLEDLSAELASIQGTLFCDFDRKNIDKLSIPAQQICTHVKKKGSSRHQQVLKETALSEFIDFLDDLKSMITSQHEN